MRYINVVEAKLDGYIKGDKYFFFCKSRCGKCSPETKLFTKYSGV